MAVEIADPILSFKQAYVPVVMGFAYYLKNHTSISSKVLPLFVVAMGVIGQCVATAMAGGEINTFTVMTGITWGFGMIGIHSGVKNLWQLLRGE